MMYSALKDAIIPLLHPITGIDGAEMREVAITRGTTVFISLVNSNRNADIWGPG